MKMNLLKIVCKNLNGFEEKKLEIDFITEKRVTSREIEDNVVSKLINRIYKFNSIAFIGINASGKTSTMNIISSVLDIYLGNVSLSYKMKISKYFNEYLEIESFYYDRSEKKIFKIWSKIRKNDEEESLFFEDEALYSKIATSQTSRENIFEFKEKNKIFNRKNIDNEFLKQEDSIFSSLMNRRQTTRPTIIDMCDVKMNLLTAMNIKKVMSFIRYLDPSIVKFEYIVEKNDEIGKAPRFKIKFNNSDKEIIVEHFELDTYLSSGTIKGISFLSNIYTIFASGGYLLIDEIENHFNKTIVMNIIKMFNSEINKNSATLIFSTHYSEILDGIDRSDSIYVMSKKQYIDMSKFSAAAGAYDRSDKKKSDVILSGLLNTSPKYAAYRALLDSFKKDFDEGNI